MKNVRGGVHRTKSQLEEGRIISEWSINDDGLYKSSGGRDVLSLSKDGKTLTIESRRTYELRMKVDDHPYELDDVVDIQSVFVKLP